MSYVKTRKCLHCKHFFKPDPKNIRHHRFCREPTCRLASKKAAQTRWLKKSENRAYFRGALHVSRVQAWRKSNPGYWKHKVKDALQDVLMNQPIEKKEDLGTTTPCVTQDISPLQDILTSQHFVLIGLISKVIDSPLQDDIASSARLLKQLGADILNRGTAHAFSRTTAAKDPYAIQLA